MRRITSILMILSSLACAGELNIGDNTPTETVAMEESKTGAASRKPRHDESPEGAPYEIGKTPFAFSWPSNPATNRVVEVDSRSKWRSAVALEGAQIVVAENMILESVTISGSDLDIFVPNSSSVQGPLMVRGDRIRWVGGNVVANHAIGLLLDSVRDVLFDNVSVYATSQLNGSEGVSMRGHNQRVAFINSTIEATGNSNIWAMHTLSRGSMTDLVLANVRVEQHFSASQRGAAYRFNPVERLIVVDSIFNGRVTNTGTGMRLSGAKDVYWRDVINVGMIHTDFAVSGGRTTFPYDVENLTVDNLHSYNSRNSEMIQHKTTGSGVVKNSTVHSGGRIGTPGIGPMRDGGGNSSVAWDGSSIDYSVVGKAALSDFGANH